MKIVVVGANGFLGVHLCKLLIEEKHTVFAFYKNPSSSNIFNEYDIPKFKIDIRDLSSLQNSLKTITDKYKDIDALVHCASYISIGTEPKETVEDINILGTKNVIKVCEEFNIKKLVYVSSIHALDHDQNTPMVDERLPSAINHKLIYNKTKSIAQELVKSAYKNGLKTIIVNPTGFLGPIDQRPSLMGKTIINIYKGKLPSLLKAGFNWIDVRDVAKGIYLALLKGKEGEQYMLGGHWKTIKELSQAIQNVTKKKTIKFCLPVYLAHLGLPFLKLYSKLTGLPPLYTYDSLYTLKEASKNISIDKARKELGYKPRKFEITMRDTCNWFLVNGYFGDVNEN